jgi:hypothetical protein
MRHTDIMPGACYVTMGKVASNMKIQTRKTDYDKLHGQNGCSRNGYYPVDMLNGGQ